VLGGNLGTAALGFVNSVLLTHVLSSESFGYYRAFMGAMMMFSSAASLGLHYTFGRRFACRQDDPAALGSSALVAYIGLSASVVVGTTGVAALLARFSPVHLESYILLAAAFVGVMFFQVYLQQRYQGENRMVSYALVSVLPQLGLLAAIAVLGVSQSSVSGVAIVAAFVVPNLLVVIAFVARDGLAMRGVRPVLRSVLHENRGFGLHLYAGALFGVTAAQVLDLIIAGISGLSQFGYYSLGLSLAAPMAFVPATMGTVRFAKSVGSMRIASREITGVLLTTGVIGGVYLVGLNLLIPLLIGRDYGSAVLYANALLLNFAVSGLGDYFNRFILAKGKGESLRNSAVVVGVVLLIGAWLLVPPLGAWGLVIAKIVSSAAYLALMVRSYLTVSRDAGISDEPALQEPRQ